ncbi:hypothetical protein QNI16_26700 [Cytophagaceae bacterium YF14B1]|uniref:Uncharacterized protein n=1 Tax=Xanthocytophaga flava TaxID=3048013 RepID=A0AAE3QSG6_9BACT|nr:hypothetical protein [Xanthocytophaga flavus]MDJ1484116.1 hypothetical protein [Xanthocytophaga flavus]
MERLFFAIGFSLDQKDRYLIWIQDETDQVLVETDGLIPVFNSETALAKYAAKKYVEIVNEEPVFCDLDYLSNWIAQPNNPIDCQMFLSIWNLFTDIASGINRSFTGNEKDKLTNKVYDKIFYGNNLPSVTPEGKYYIPVWTKAERGRLIEIMSEGIALLRISLKEIDI